MIGCGMASSTILGSTFGAGSYRLHRVRVYSRPFSVDPPVKINDRLFRSIHKKSPNTGFVLSNGLVNNPLISPRFWNSTLGRYGIRNCHVSVLIMLMKWSPLFCNYSAAGTDAKYDYEQTILSVLAHGVTSPFSTFVP